MSIVRKLLPLLFLLLSIGVAPVASAAAPIVDAKMSVALIQYNGQFEVSASATSARPGDVLEYTARYANRGNAAADALSPSMPIPVGTEYLPTDKTPRPTHASLDGVKFAPVPLQRAVKGPDGTTRMVEIPASEYRALRWTVGTLAPGSEVTVRARVRLAQLTSLASQ